MEKGSDKEEKTHGKNESALKSLQNRLYRPLSLSMGFRGVERQKRAIPVANFRRRGSTSVEIRLSVTTC